MSDGMSEMAGRGRQQAMALLRNVREMGVLVRARGPELMLLDPEKRLTHLLRAQIVELRAEILDVLAGAETVAAFARSGRRLVIRSAVLGEPVILAADDADLDSEMGTRWRRGRGLPPGTPVYRAREMPALLGLSPAGLRLVHEVKTTFDGEVTF